MESKRQKAVKKPLIQNIETLESFSEDINQFYAIITYKIYLIHFNFLHKYLLYG